MEDVEDNSQKKLDTINSQQRDIDKPEAKENRSFEQDVDQEAQPLKIKTKLSDKKIKEENNSGKDIGEIIAKSTSPMKRLNSKISKASSGKRVPKAIKVRKIFKGFNPSKVYLGKNSTRRSLGGSPSFERSSKRLSFKRNATMKRTVEFGQGFFSSGK
mmetsp:Transcript_8156/g.7234  ORF Transcript_8156/g.7234 Transcript_8156/m.7234 type:complete len:158 (-) Transcript_8156:970-1443(-)